MARNITRLKLSGSTNGRPISVGTSSTTLHTATSDGDQLDTVELYVFNVDTQPQTLTIECGGTSFPDAFTMTVPAKGSAGSDGLIPVGTFDLQGGVNLRAKAGSASKLGIVGRVVRQDVSA